MSFAAQVYRKLFEHYGPQNWWPAQTPFEVAVGAVLVQNTAWRNVERAIENLRSANALSPRAIAAFDSSTLEDLVRPAGYFRLKAKRLRNLIDFFLAEYDGSFQRMQGVKTQALRSQLLNVNGVGPETADSILNYALGKPALVVDAYTLRIWARHGWSRYNADYHQLQSQLLAELPRDAALFNELHALIVRTGHEHCRRTPKCDGCPLKRLLPESGIAAPGG